ncbi:HD domain-containing protein [Oceanotoga sp. DSM 15011]|uniref:HD domain-containing protein n=1 Tax=Oceanotoga teriensis TaxID=515440 RepID=A0AA45HJ89_9BACT|nr:MULTISPECIES: HD domain-containing protein [Oceanotoga]PWJ95590.1 uncharacterized protein C7380_1044 [Oceanotoga teriensis]UYO99423.1 HD domain-containing protein [Oceanotoga sp. DSM 15011]
MNSIFVEKTRDYILSQEYHITHSIDHIFRVLKNSIFISTFEGGDMEEIAISALLHDIARDEELKNPKIDHAEKGAEIAKNFLININYPKHEEVYYNIMVHRYSKGKIPKTIEAKILQDADRLDALGAIGISRVLMHNNGETLNKRIEHFYDKILKLKDGMNTQKGYELALEKHRLVEKFVHALEEELRY